MGGTTHSKVFPLLYIQETNVNYEGSMMPWFQYAPYTAPLRVMLCGGSTPSGIALDNCVHIEPDTPNATWTLERMVSHVRAFVICYAQPI